MHWKTLGLSEGLACPTTLTHCTRHWLGSTIYKERDLYGPQHRSLFCLAISRDRLLSVTKDMGSSWFRSACSLILIILTLLMGVRVSIAEVQGVEISLSWCGCRPSSLLLWWWPWWHSSWDRSCGLGRRRRRGDLWGWGAVSPVPCQCVWLISGLGVLLP